MTPGYSKTDFTTELNVWQKVIYYLLWSIVYLISLLPFRVLYAISDFLYLIIYKVVGYRTKLVRKNLKDSFPEKSADELLSIEKRFYHFFCDYIFETIKLASMTKAEMYRRVIYKNKEHMRQVVSEGRSIALYLGHICNWEWVTSVGMQLPDEMFAGQVYHVLEDKVMNALLLKLRAAMDTESISMQITLRKIIDIKRSGRQMLIGFISDQVPLYQATRHWTDFLNHKDTIVITGTEQIATKCDFVSVYFDITRPRRGYYEISVVYLADNPKELEEFELTDRYFRALEANIQRNPEYWLWTHNRWKRDLPGLVEWAKTHGTAGETTIRKIEDKL